MLSLFTIWQSFQSLVNTAQNSFFRPYTDFQQSVNDISKELWDQWTSSSEKNQQVRDYLAPFLKSKNIMVQPRNSYYGVVLYPKDYGRYASAAVWSIRNQCVPCPDVDNGKCKGYKTQEEVNEEYYRNIEERQVDLIDEQRWKACLTHLTKMPTIQAPKITQIDGGWKVAPKDVSIIVLDYYKVPAEGTFLYTVEPGNPQTGSGDYIIFNTSSVSLEWPETVLNYFLWKLAKRYGVFIGNQFLAQFSEQQKMTA